MFPVLAILAGISRKVAIRTAVTSARYHMSSQGMPCGKILKAVADDLPFSLPSRRKGQCGRLAVVGGSEEYTGAPYFAAISMLKAGADLAHIFCLQAAATAIKSYSPELIVHPLLDKPGGVSDIKTWLPRLHSLVIGPGLGRDPLTMKNVKEIITEAKNLQLPLIIDGDGLALVTSEPDLIRNYGKAILTPNGTEFKRLYEAVMQTAYCSDDDVNCAQRLSKELQIVLVQKGHQDIITDGESILVCAGDGSPRRCGGQGDILSGLLGAFSFWMHEAKARGSTSQQVKEFGPSLLAAYAACCLTRECARRAYLDLGRSTLASDMIIHIHAAFDSIFGR